MAALIVRNFALLIVVCCTLMDRMPHKQHRLNNGAALISPAIYATSPSSISARSSLHLLQTSDAMTKLSKTDFAHKQQFDGDRLKYVPFLRRKK